MTNSRARLNELSQTKRLSAPVYSYERDPSSPDHIPLWKAKVNCGVYEANTNTFAKTKAEAAEIAAQMCLKEMQEIDSMPFSYDLDEIKTALVIAYRAGCDASKQHSFKKFSLPVLNQWLPEVCPNLKLIE